jgi:hypothetical protein
VIGAGPAALACAAMVLATGFRPDLRPLLPEPVGVFDARGLPLMTGRSTTGPVLLFCGHLVMPTGQLREIGIEAQRIAQRAATYLSR